MAKLPCFKTKAEEGNITVKVNPWWVGDILIEAESGGSYGWPLETYRITLSPARARKIAQHLIKCAEWGES